MLTALLWLYLAVGTALCVYLCYLARPLRRRDLLPMLLVAVITIGAWPIALVVLAKLLVGLKRRSI